MICSDKFIQKGGRKMSDTLKAAVERLENEYSACSQDWSKGWNNNYGSVSGGDWEKNWEKEWDNS